MLIWHKSELKEIYQREEITFPRPSYILFSHEFVNLVASPLLRTNAQSFRTVPIMHENNVVKKVGSQYSTLHV